MKKIHRIENIFAHEIIDSRSNPTVEVYVRSETGECGVASVPSGASTGIHEAHELRDGDKSRYNGKGVQKAVDNVNGIISASLCGKNLDPIKVDNLMLNLDGTENKAKLGSNATLAVSLAVARTASICEGLPLYRFLGGTNARRLPIPMMNIINGGAHASNNLDIQEFMIMPTEFGCFRDALQAGCEVYQALASLLKSDGKSTGVGDEGGFAPDLRDEREALEYIVSAIDKAGYSDRINIALDVAASEWYSEGIYKLPKSGETLSAEQVIDKIERLSNDYPIVSVEDALGEDDFEGWRSLTMRLGGVITLVGDDLFVTNQYRLNKGIENGMANAILIKPNQIGTLSETLEVIRIAKENGYRTVISHRSGETADAFIADLAVGMNAGYIKTGAPCRGERTSKYNRLLAIEAELGSSASFGNNA